MIRSSLLLACVALGCSSGSARLVTVAVHEFGDVPAGQTGSSTLQAGNEGDVASADFAVGTSSVRLEPGAGGVLTLTFTPRTLGPQRATLVLTGASGETRAALSGVGVGAQLGVSHPLFNLGTLPLVVGAPPESFKAQLTLTNTGTRGTTLQLQAPLVDGAEVCVGALVSGACDPWVAPTPLARGESLVLPLVVTPTQAGQRAYDAALQEAATQRVLRDVPKRSPPRGRRLAVAHGPSARSGQASPSTRTPRRRAGRFSARGPRRLTRSIP